MIKWNRSDTRTLKVNELFSPAGLASQVLYWKNSRKYNNSRIQQNWKACSLNRSIKRNWIVRPGFHWIITRSWNLAIQAGFHQIVTLSWNSTIKINENLWQSFLLSKAWTCPRFWRKYLHYKARTCFNNRAISRSRYDLPGIRHGFQ